MLSFYAQRVCVTDHPNTYRDKFKHTHAQLLDLSLINIRRLLFPHAFCHKKMFKNKNWKDIFHLFSFFIHSNCLTFCMIMSSHIMNLCCSITYILALTDKIRVQWNNNEKICCCRILIYYLIINKERKVKHHTSCVVEKSPLVNKYFNVLFGSLSLNFVCVCDSIYATLLTTVFVFF